MCTMPAVAVAAELPRSASVVLVDKEEAGMVDIAPRLAPTAKPTRVVEEEEAAALTAATQATAVPAS